MTDPKEMIERLRATYDTGRRTDGTGSVGYGLDGQVKYEMTGNEPIMALRNPDGPEAATLIEQLVKERDEARDERDGAFETLEEQQALAVKGGDEIARIREALERIANYAAKLRKGTDD